MNPLRIASFSSDGEGGNPAGVVIATELPTSDQMQTIAAELGFSETAFATRTDHGSRWCGISGYLEPPGVPCGDA